MAKKPSPEKRTKLRPDVNEVAHRVMLEATGQAPKTLPPGERSSGERHGVHEGSGLAHVGEDPAFDGRP